MILLQFILLTAIFVMGWVCGTVMVEEMRKIEKPKKKKPLTFPTYGDESPEEVFRMMQEAKKFKK
jgi:hypothetical protein